ncbi:metal-dependent hydrolase [Candidatus Woesearchaeota archaeon]|nr:metal-dependent hydrolase [Candidatus Woesearchaeota archaeon]
MPDLMSHLIIGLILAELFNVKKKSIVILGALTPDLLSKMNLVYLYLKIPALVSFVSFHTPFMSLLLSILITQLFNYDKTKIVLYFNLGSMSHYLSDLSIRHFTEVGTRLFFPFTNKNYTLNLVWPNHSIYILIGSLIVYFIIILIKYKKLSKSTTRNL